MILFRPVGLAELALVARTGFKAFPPRLPEQPFFYPVLTEAYAHEIARDWNTKDEASAHAGFVLLRESSTPRRVIHPRTVDLLEAN